MYFLNHTEVKLFLEIHMCKKFKLMYFPTTLPYSIHYRKNISYKKYNLLSSSGMTQITPFISQETVLEAILHYSLMLWITTSTSGLLSQHFHKRQIPWGKEWKKLSLTRGLKKSSLQEESAEGLCLMRGNSLRW